MKWFAASLLLAAGVAQADIKLEFVEKTIPVYPAELRKSAITGSVRVGFKVRFDGVVSDVQALQSSDPAFTAAALEAVRHWRFKPWTVSTENPPMVDVENDLVFRLNDKRQWMEIFERAGLIVMTCRQFNDEVALYRKDAPTRSLNDMQTTRVSIRMIAQATEGGATSFKKSRVASQAFEQALPGIVERCRTYPGLDFVDVWPSPLREKLAQAL
ncbi:energy transducer TonB [Pseudomonas tructae]|uniref:Energy transducer TonB n=1 Tax=Pseudomonas tructae TaxID=2518644 RepID=A0A411MBP8_9PSED|nr:energy transducer TonB [Pseudomonas tructae]QBF24223.1 energy transducer TonB [Pseudomonas tructae]